MSAASPGQYPIRLEFDYHEDANRLTTFFRYLLSIPHTFLLAFFAIAVSVVVMVLWFVIMITGRRHEGMTRFIVGYLRWSLRANAYGYLLTDEYPPFNSD